jgi:uncharacterized oligopeptide transporter (OPT) family protein
MTTDYSEAIERGVSNWLDANAHVIINVVSKAVAERMDKAIEEVATGIMNATGKFLNDNGEDLKTGIAMAIATSWAARQHPVPK